MNLPNKITLARVCMIPIFMIVLMCGAHYNWQYYYIWAALVFAIASFTDGVDGHIARSRNLITDFGKFMDPLADKLLVSTALICFIQLNWIPAYMAVIIIAREFIVTGLRLIAVNEGKVIAAGMSGKIKTVTQIIATVLLLIDPTVLNNLNSFMIDKTIALINGFVAQPLIAVIGILANVMVYISVFFTIYSCVVYIKQNVDVLKLDDC